MHTQQIVLTERTHDKTAGKISEAKAQDAEARHEADDSHRQKYTFRNDIGFILAEYIADARQDNRIIADVEIDERRDDVEPPCRIDLPGKVLCGNPLDVDRPKRSHHECSRQSNAEIQPPTSGQHTTDQRVIRLTLRRRERDTVLLQVSSTTPGIRHTVAQRRRKAAVHELHQSADADEHIPKAQEIRRQIVYQDRQPDDL